MYDFLVVLGALGLVVFLLRRRWKTGAALLVSAAALALALWATPEKLWAFLERDWGHHPLATTFPVQTVDLVLLVVLVNFLGQVLRESGLSDRLTSGLGTIFRSRRLAVAGVPAVMGLLPTPGGIMLSAPMVRDAAERYGLSGTRAALINYWFRHQWEYVFPLFPAVPMVAGFMGVPVGAFIKWNLCATVAGVVFGGLVLLRGFPPAQKPVGPRGPGWAHALIGISAALWPVALALILCTALQLPAGMSLAAAVALLVIVQRMRPAEMAAAFRQGAELDLVMVILGAMAYRAILDASGAVHNISGFIAALGLPVPVMVFLLPFIVGTATGITSATVALSFPVILDMVAPSGSQPDLALAALGFFGGVAGLTLTPVHLCLALSRDYFKTSFAAMYKSLVPLVLLVAAAVWTMALIWRHHP